MTKEAVYNTPHAQPFKPFSLRLTDGKLVLVPHPHFAGLSPGGRTAVIMSEGESFAILDLALATAIELDSPGTSKAQ